MPPRRPGPALLAYATFVLLGLNLGANGVLLPAQITDYGIDKATIGITFFTFAAGFMVAGGTVGPLVARLGARSALVLGGTEFVLGGLVLASRPAFWAFVAVQVLVGHGIGTVESELNAWLSELPSPAVRLNRLHAFFGVGALLGPLLTTWFLGPAGLEWTAVTLVMALLAVPLMAGFHLTVPPPSETGVPGRGETEPGSGEAPIASGLLLAVLKSPVVVLAAVFLAVYVGLEVSVGNWAFSFLVSDRGTAGTTAGWLVSGFWLGLTLGRFLISPLAARAGLTQVATTAGVLTGVMATAVLIWVVPVTAVAGAGFALMGFFLGPVFPTAMAVVPELTTSRLAGVLAQTVGGWTLLPFVVVLGLVQLICWRRIRPPDGHSPTGHPRAGGGAPRAQW